MVGPLIQILVKALLPNYVPPSPAFAGASARKREERFRYSSVSEVASLGGD